MTVRCLVSSPEPIKFVAKPMAAPRSTPWLTTRWTVGMRRIRDYTSIPTALEEPQSDSSPHQWTSIAHAIEASFRRTSKSLSPVGDQRADHDPVGARFLVCTSEPGAVAPDLHTVGMA